MLLSGFPYRAPVILKAAVLPKVVAPRKGRILINGSECGMVCRIGFEPAINSANRI
jgi:hypothetical protein